MAKIILHSSEDGVLFFDTKESWFYFRSNAQNTYPIMMYRVGNFDLTTEEWNAITEFLKRNLKDGVLQS